MDWVVAWISDNLTGGFQGFSQNLMAKFLICPTQVLFDGHPILSQKNYFLWAVCLKMEYSNTVPISRMIHHSFPDQHMANSWEVSLIFRHIQFLVMFLVVFSHRAKESSAFIVQLWFASGWQAETTKIKINKMRKCIFWCGESAEVAIIKFFASSRGAPSWLMCQGVTISTFTLFFSKESGVK